MLKRLLYALLPTILLLQVSVTPANIDMLIDHSNGEANSFIPVEEAFSATGRLENGNAYIDFKVIPGHYLYKDRFNYFNSPTISKIGTPVYPPSKSKFDANFNRNVDIFTDDFTIKIPVTITVTPPSIDIRFQGCADAGLCYPPHRITIPLSESGSLEEPPVPAITESLETHSSPIESFETSEHYYQKQLKESGLLLAILLFFITGIGLSFTPCVLPMIPIVSSIILGNYQPKRTKVIGLTLTYILTMSLTFALAGTLTGLFGASLNLQAKLQSPWLIYPFSALFALLALSMFGLYELQLPAFLREKLGITPSRQGSIASAAFMGLLSALVVSPCVSAPLAGALIYISTTEDALLGGLSLFSLGLGMGAPLLAIALGGKHILPRSGSWMESVRAFFGVLMLMVAIWMLERVIPARISMALWGTLAIGCSIFLGALNLRDTTISSRLKQATGIVLLTYGICLIIGFAKGSTDLLKPLAYKTANPSEQQHRASFQTINTLTELQAALKTAAQANSPVVLDIYADWCVSCKTIERKLFSAPEINELFAGITLLKFDITANTSDQILFLSENQLFGPPALLFFNAEGKQLSHLKLAGLPTILQLRERLEKLLSPVNKV